MSCSGCGGHKTATVVNNTTPVQKRTFAGKVVEASETTDKKVRLRYYGGGMSARKVAKCAACGSAKASYARTTNEMIMFASDDAPNGMYQQFVEIGRDYWVTEKQAEYMLTLEYINQAGQTVKKFKRVN